MTDLFLGSSLEDAPEPLTVLAYGQPGSGKSTGGLQMANRGRVIAINVEGGLKPTALRQQGVNTKNVTIWPPQGKGADYITYDTLEAEVFQPLKAALVDAREQGQPDPIVGIVIDSFSELSRRLMDDVVAKAKAKAAMQGKARDAFQVDLADHGTVSQMVRSLLRRFRDLEVHLWITALERRDIDDDSKVKYGPAVGPAIANDTMGLVDVIVYCTVEEIGGETFFIGNTRPTDRRHAKDRFNVLPTRMVDPTSDRMLSYLEGSLQRLSDPRQLAAKAAIQREAGNEVPAAPAAPAEQAAAAPAAEEQVAAEAAEAEEANEGVSEASGDTEAASEGVDTEEGAEPPSKARRVKAGASA